MVAIGDRTHRVTICSARDVGTEDGELLKARTGVVTGWAAIIPVKANRFSRDGTAVDDNHMVKTHEIIMNYNPDLNISVSAWIFEVRRKSPPRWFKIIRVTNVGERSREWKFECRLVEAADDIAKPVQTFGAVPLPSGIKL